jgi:histidine triad (HIT) family protein
VDLGSSTSKRIREHAILRAFAFELAPDWADLLSPNGILTDIMTIFEKIIARQIPAKIIWEDDDAVVFQDVNPQAPVHVLIVPKKVVPRLTDAKDDDRALLGKLLLVARDMAQKLELSSGYRVVINCGPDAGESVPHLHVHLLGKRALAWPPG